jgi:transglutaminase-like putative cysteine protease
MKFGLTHRILTSALAALGVLAIVLSGALPRISTILLLVGLAGAIAATEKFQQSQAARYAAAIIPSVLLGVEFLRLVSGTSLLDLAVEFAAALQIVRLATRRGAMHDQQVILLALLHLVAGTVLGGGIAYGLCLVGFLVLAPGALVLSHLRREVEGNYRQGARDRTGLPVDVPRILRSRRVIGPGFLALTCVLSLPIIVFTALLFIFFPRVGLSLLLMPSQRNTRLVGFSETVDLGGVGMLRSDPTPVLRFWPQEIESPPREKYVIRLRGTAFDEYKGTGLWTRSTNERTPLNRFGADVSFFPSRQMDPSRDSVLRIDLEPIDPTVLFLPSRSIGLKWRSGLEPGAVKPPQVVRGPESTYRYEAAPDRVLRYDVYVAPPGDVFDETLAPRDRERYLQLPKDLPTRIKDLAVEWSGTATSDIEKASKISHHLETEYRYHLSSSSSGKPNPVDHFLFTSKEGHCEFFSTAMVLLLREVGVPARNVGGYVGGTYNRFGGYYAVRQGDAHSWVEAYVEQNGRHGWMTFDPTPPAGAQPVERHGAWITLRDMFEAISQSWDRYVVGYDLPQQISLFTRIQRSIEKARKGSSDEKKSSSGPISKKPFVYGGLVFVAAAGAYYVWRKRRLRGEPIDEAQAGRVRQQRIATELWLALEEALQARGASRPRHVPPLRFAEQLREQRKDAVGEEAFLLASRYVEARFGHAPLSTDEQREFARRVAALRRGDDAQPA